MTPPAHHELSVRSLDGTLVHIFGKMDAHIASEAMKKTRKMYDSDIMAYCKLNKFDCVFFYFGDAKD